MLKFKILYNLGPVKKNFISQTTNLGFRTLITLFLIPFYIKYLGNDLYSDWLVLLAIPGIFELTNFGINQAVNNTFSIFLNRNKNNSDRIISHGIYYTLIIGFLTLINIYFFWDLLKISNFLNLTEIDSYNSKLITLFLTLKVFTDMVKGILGSYFFAYNNNYYNINLNTIQFLLDSLIIVSAILSGLSLSSLSFYLIFPSIFTCLFLFTVNTYKFNYRFNLRFSLEYFKILIKPSSSFSILTISQYILNQGFIIVFKKFYTAELLIIFNSSKTLINYITKVQGLIASSYYPSFNNLFSKFKFDELRKVFYKSNRMNIVLSICMITGFIIFGEQVWNLWLGGGIKFSSQLFYFLLLIQFIASFWLIPSNVIISSNQHFYFSIIFMFSSILSLILFYFFSLYKDIDFSYSPLFYLAHQLIMMFFSYYTLKQIINFK